jgi:hypothetical protein
MQVELSPLICTYVTIPNNLNSTSSENKGETWVNCQDGFPFLLDLNR